MKRGLVLAGALLGALLLVTSLGAFALWYGYTRVPLCNTCDAPTYVVVDEKMSGRGLVRALTANHLVRYPRLLLAILRYSGISKRLQTGVYVLKPHETASELLARIVAGDVMSASFRIIEGTTLSRVMENLQSAPWIVFDPDMATSFRGEHLSAEGLFLADTYQYKAGSSAKALLARAHANLESVLQASFAGRDPDLPFRTPYEMLTAASIVEKETADPSERRLVASVLVNRLRKHMPLQMDPTVIYGLGANYRGKLSHEDMQTPSPWNTYLHQGLPPTPIAMAGRDAIEAVAHPALTRYLYFVARGDGTHEFSETYQSQRSAINRYLRKRNQP